MSVSVRVQTLGKRARGSFGKNRQVSPELLALLKRDEFWVPSQQAIIGVCSDERCAPDGTRLLAPACFGGFAVLAHIDALTTRASYARRQNMQQHTLALRDALRQKGLINDSTVCSIHTDVAAVERQQATNAPCECGCAALVSAAAVARLLATEYYDLVPEEYHSRLVAGVAELRADYYVPNTAAMVAELAGAGIACEVLEGEHEGVAVVVNDRDGYVLDRPMLYAALHERGVRAPVFVYDRWALRRSAQFVSPRNHGYYFVVGDALTQATMFAICHPTMSVLKVS